ncbi:MAG: response regulator [Bacteroidota bacterium]
MNNDTAMLNKNIKTTKEADILVIDDSTTNVVLIEAVLSEMGYHIIPTLNAKEAYKAIEKKVPDLILLDLLMPRISGYDFLKQIKSSEETKNIPVIVISAVTDQPNVQKIMNMGADEFINKPLDIEELVEKVENILG